MFLTVEEIVSLTGRQRRDAQARVLTFMGIEHKLRPDGSVAVLREHVNQILGAKTRPEKAVKEFELNW